MIFISIYLNHAQSTSPPCIPFQYISILSSSSDPLICPPFHSHETPWLSTSSFHKPASPLWHFGFSRGRLKESDEKKNATNSSAPLWSRVCSEWFGFHCEWQNHTMYSIDDTFWIIWIIWIFQNISYFLHLFHTASEFIPLVWAVKSHTTGRNLQSGPVHATLCQGLQVLQEEMNEKKRERERTQPSEHEATREPFKMSCGPWTLCLSMIVPMHIN